jgi:hypothetical protein
MKKLILKNMFLAVAIIVSLFVILFLLIPKAETTYASDSPIDYDCQYIVDGVYVGNEVSLERGQEITIKIQYQGEIYEPMLYINSNKFACDIDGNKLFLKDNSYIGECFEVFANIDIGKETLEFVNPLIVMPKIEKDFTNDIKHILDDGYKISLSNDVKAVYAEIITDDAGKSYAWLSDGDSIEAESYSDVEVNILEVEITTIDQSNVETSAVLDEDIVSLKSVSLTTSSLLSGEGTSSSPYLIASATDFGYIYSFDSSSETIYFEQTADISFSGYKTIQYKTFYGNYDGNYYSLQHSGEVCYSGFCKYNYGEISNLTINYYQDCYMSTFYSGGVCSKNYGDITNVDVEALYYYGFAATIYLSTYCQFGGIATYNQEDGRIEECNISLVVLTENWISGGIVAYNYGTLDSNVVNISFYNYDYGNYYYGGLAGRNYSTGMCAGNEVASFILVFDCPTSSYTPMVGGLVGQNEANLWYVIFNTMPDEDYFSCNASDTTYVNRGIGVNV